MSQYPAIKELRKHIDPKDTQSLLARVYAECQDLIKENKKLSKYV